MRYKQKKEKKTRCFAKRKWSEIAPGHYGPQSKPPVIMPPKANPRAPLRGHLGNWDEFHFVYLANLPMWCQFHQNRLYLNVVDFLGDSCPLIPLLFEFLDSPKANHQIPSS